MRIAKLPADVIGRPRVHYARDASYKVDCQSHRISRRLPVGRGNVGVSDRRLAAGRRRRAEHLAPLLSHARPGARRRHRRRRLRSLPALARRRRADARARPACLSLQHRRGAAFCPQGTRRGERSAASTSTIGSSTRCSRTASSRWSRSFTGICPRRSTTAAAGSIATLPTGSPSTRASCSASSTTA